MSRFSDTGGPADTFCAAGTGGTLYFPHQSGQFYAPCPRTRLGPYQILAPIGAGGMGEVYKATDTRLERTVAIKVLPAHVASTPSGSHGSSAKRRRRLRSLAWARRLLSGAVRVQLSAAGRYAT